MPTDPAPTPATLPIGPKSTRVFGGYRLPRLTREAFFKELGATFMPGTPYMLAPLGLAAYVAAVLDVDPADGLPDEVALIVYASNDAYTAAREHSLQGRMYTHAHAGVFDMARSRGQFPGTPDVPHKLADTQRWSWALADRAVDWQYGSTRLLFLKANAGTATDSTALQQALLDLTRKRKTDIEAAGVDQMIVLANSDYAAVWLHGADVTALDPATLGLICVEGSSLLHDLVATPVHMTVGTEGPTINGTAAYTFRFVRDPHFFL